MSIQKLMDSHRTIIMGILNVTPDSFSDGGKFFAPEDAITHAQQMVADGADIIDIGGESSRPGSEPVSAEDEIARILPILQALSGKVDVPISVDTYKSEVAKVALENGATIINDISGLRFDAKIAELVAEHNAWIVLMHILGTPKTMQKNIVYKNLIGDIYIYLQESIEIALAAGIPEGKIIVDPGIGFGKTVEHNLEILKRLKEFKKLGQPILIGTSRKSFIGKILDVPVDQRLAGSLATFAVSVMNGAKILRVHDVKAAKQAAVMVDSILKV